jgi:dolichol kinase
MAFEKLAYGMLFAYGVLSDRYALMAVALDRLQPSVSIIDLMSRERLAAWICNSLGSFISLLPFNQFEIGLLSVLASIAFVQSFQLSNIGRLCSALVAGCASAIAYDFHALVKSKGRSSLQALQDSVLMILSTFLASCMILQVNVTEALLGTNIVNRIIICSYWACMLIVYLGGFYWFMQDVPLNWRRKFFHFLAVLLLVPAYLIDHQFLQLGLCVALILFIALEYFRVQYRLTAVSAFFRHNIKPDTEGNSPFIVAHIQLLLGCALPVWMAGGPTSVGGLSGVLAIGIADAMASIVGRSIGRLRPFPSKKSIEGALGALVSCILIRRLLGHPLVYTACDLIVCVAELLLPSRFNDSLVLSMTALLAHTALELYISA